MPTSFRSAMVTRRVSNTAHTTKALPVRFAPLLPAAHLTLLAAKGGLASPASDPTVVGDADAQALIASTVDQAEGGAPDAMGVAQVLDAASKMQRRATYVHFWLYGDGARIAGA